MKSRPSLKLSLAVLTSGLCMTSLQVHAADQETTEYIQILQGSRSENPLLTKMESLAEDAFDNALIGDFQKAKIAASKTVASWQGYRNQAIRDGANGNLITAMDVSVDAFSRVTQHSADKFKIARAANSVSANMENFFTLYNPRIPPVIMTLDYLGREIVVDGLTDDFANAELHLSHLAATWVILKPSAEAATGGIAVAAKYAASIDAMHSDIQARNANGLVVNAKLNLELTDAVEMLYAQ